MLTFEVFYLLKQKRKTESGKYLTLHMVNNIRSP